MARFTTAEDLADITMGSFIQGSKTKILLDSWHKDRAKEIRSAATKFNEAIRQNTPSIAILDAKLIANEVLTVLDELTTKYIKSIDIPGDIPSFSGDKDFEQQVDSYLAVEQDNIYNKLISNITSELHSGLDNITMVEIRSIVNEIQTNILTSQGARNVSMAKAGAQLRSKLSTIGTVEISDANTFIANLGNRIAVMSYSFIAGKEKVNKLIQSAVEKTFKSTRLKLSPEFKVGNIVHAGHVGFYEEDKTLIGINTPGAIAYGAAADRFNEIEKSVGNISLHVEYGLKVKKEWSDTAGILLSLGFNISVSMEDYVNSGKLSSQEVAAIKRQIEDLAEKQILAHLDSKINKGVLDDLVPLVRTSPNLVEFIETLLANTIQGKKTPKVSSTKQVKRSKDVKPKVTTTKTTSKKKITVSPTTTLKPLPKKKKVNVGPNLTSLQNILNMSLFEAIKKNMGTGASKNMLNFRTGRFAQSAKVQKITQGSTGMLTMFYSYMKYPYQTFEPGHRQGSPKSRDPRLLISKSIRDIAAVAVDAKFRSVSV